MPAREQELIDSLRGAAHSGPRAKVALTRAAEYLEESYILNLPPSRPLLTALDGLAKNAATPAPLRTRAQALIKQYRI